jgi:glycosyltransferase involved in cell wall biosynthesis
MPPPEETPRAALRAGLLRTLFGLMTGFMVSGMRNGEYYAHYGADRKTFFLLPWAIDNDRFADAARMTTAERAALRAQHDLAPEAVAILFSAKLVARKDPFTLLRAFLRMRKRHEAVLLFMGDGELRAGLERFAREHALQNVIFLGFINQREIPRYYAMADVFVLPSTYEPRGAVINEAMACGLPVIVTDRCGSVGDIVRNGENGFVFRAGDDVELSGYLDALTSDPDLRTGMSECSLQLIRSWDFTRGVRGVKEMLRWVTAR